MTNRVLAAEDSPTQAAILRSHLENAGFQVAMAGDGAEALALFQRETFDLVVSDVVMPGVDGYGLCRGVKDRDPGVPVVLLTSMTDPLDVVHALAAGADNFLRKPYQPEELIHRVRNMLYNKELRQSGRTQIGLELFFLGRRFMINSDREQILDLLVSTFEDLVTVNERLREQDQELGRTNDALQSQLAATELEQERLQAVLAALPQGLGVLDAEGRVVEANENMGQLLGVDPSSLVGAMAWEATQLSSHDRQPIAPEWVEHLVLSGRSETIGSGFDIFVDRPDGRRIPVMAKSAPIRGHGGAVLGSVVVVEDIGELFAHDPVTGLPGHGIVVERLRAASGFAESGETTGLMVVTVDRFERIREGVPPGGGDAILVEVVRRLNETLKSPRVQQRSPMASAAHLGNGELAVILPEVRSERDVVAVGEILVEQLAGMVEVGTLDMDIGVSVGVGVCAPETEPAALIAAVAASARHLSAGGGRSVATSDPGMHAGVVSRLRREVELRRAIDSGELVAHYQPQIQLRGGHPAAVEALVRWEHPEHGLLGAGDIVPLAIDCGLIAPLGWLMLEQTCRQAHHWRQELPGAESLVLSVNVAAEQLAEADVVEHVDRILTDTGFDPSALVLEITETSVMDGSRSIGERLRGIKALGVQIAIDDFGTGYSSLLQLRHLPIDILKIDRSFVDGMIDESADAAIVAGTVSLARALGLELVAEGVETMEQLVQLRVLGCDFGQGFHWTQPLAADDLAQWWTRQPHATDSEGPPLSFLSTGDDGESDTIAYLIHELRSPLTAITGFADLLAKGSDPASAPEVIDGIRRNARELESRLASVNEARHAEQGGISLSFEDVELVDLVQTLVRDLRPQLLPHAVDVRADAPVTVSVDRSRLVQALTNLLTNAAKFSPGDTPIEVTVGSQGGEAVVGVRDHGPGIPAHRRPELFRRFSRLGSRNKGMGVGLYLSRLIMIAHGGSLGYEPAPDGGSIFSIRVPERRAVGAEADADAKAPAPLRPDTMPVDGQAAVRVTVVHIEDNIAIAQLVHKLMATKPGVELHHAADGGSGVSLAVEHQPDLVLLDLNLPDLPGEEVLRRLRADPRTDATRVVVVSAEVTPTMQADLEGLGADGILRKPFDIDDLFTIVDELQRSRGEEDERGRSSSIVGSDVVGEEAPPGADGPLDRRMIAALHQVHGSSLSTGGLEPAVQAFSEDVRVKLRALREAVGAGDGRAAGDAAHALTGLTASFGAHVAAERCRELQRHVEAGDLEAAAAAVDDLASVVREADEALRQEFCRPDAGSGTQDDGG